MILSIQEVEVGNTLVEDWPLPLRPKFIYLQAASILKRELERYSRGDVRGRSFLIAGHRGAGKTTLALRIVDDVGRDIVTNSLQSNQPVAAGGQHYSTNASFAGQAAWTQPADAGAAGTGRREEGEQENRG